MAPFYDPIYILAYSKSYTTAQKYSHSYVYIHTHVYIHIHVYTFMFIDMYVYVYVCVCVYIYIYRVPQEESARLRDGVPYVKVYRYNPKDLCPKLNGYGDNGQRKVWSSCVSTHCTCQLIIPVLACGVKLRQVNKR
jgi:hypothetical protein